MREEGAAEVAVCVKITHVVEGYFPESCGHVDWDHLVSWVAVVGRYPADSQGLHHLSHRQRKICQYTPTKIHTCMHINIVWPYEWYTFTFCSFYCNTPKYIKLQPFLMAVLRICENISRWCVILSHSFAQNYSCKNMQQRPLWVVPIVVGFLCFELKGIPQPTFFCFFSWSCSTSFKNIYPFLLHRPPTFMKRTSELFH